MRLGQKLAVSMLLGLSLLMSLALLFVFHNLNTKKEQAIQEQTISILQVQQKQLRKASEEWGHLLEVIVTDSPVTK